MTGTTAELAVTGLDALRRVHREETATFTPYRTAGRTPAAGLSWAPIAFDEAAWAGTFFLKFAPGARSDAHVHTHGEQFLVLSGELVDSDGQVLRAGDFVNYPVDSEHSSIAPDGCVLLVILKGPSRAPGKPSQEQN